MPKKREIPSGTMGARLRAARKRSGLTLDAVGKGTGVSAQAVAQWEYNDAEPSIDKLTAMTKLFGLQLSDLIGNHHVPDTFSDRFERALEILPTAQTAIIDTAMKSAAHDGFYVVQLKKGGTSGPIVARVVWPKKI